MIPETLQELLGRLLDKTLRKEVIWQKVGNRDEYKLKLDIGAITTDRWTPEGKSYESIDLVIYNDRGDVIDKVTVTEVSSIVDFAFLSDFHSSVRRSYYKVEETIKGIFDEINKDGVIGSVDPETDGLPF